MSQKEALQLFEERKVRTVWDDQEIRFIRHFERYGSHVGHRVSV